jgi:hypothetical protein
MSPDPKDPNWILDFLKRQKDKEPASEEKIENPRTVKPKEVRVDRGEGHEIDNSLGVLNELLDAGYDTLELIVPNTACDKCKAAAGEKDLREWISGLQHEAPLFEATHPDDGSCYFVVKDSNGELPSKIVTKHGTVEDA